MASNKNRIKNRDRLFSIIEKYQNKTDSIITLYFNQRKDLKVNIKVPLSKNFKAITYRKDKFYE